MTINQATAIRAAHDPDCLQEVLVAILDDSQRTRDLALAATTAIDDVLATLAVASTDDVDGDGYHGHCLSSTTQLRLRNIRHALESQAQTVAA